MKKKIQEIDFSFFEEIDEIIKNTKCENSYERSHNIFTQLKTNPRFKNIIFGGKKGCIILSDNYVLKFSLYKKEESFKREKEIYKKAKNKQLEKYFLIPIKSYYLPRYKRIIHIYNRVQILSEEQCCKYVFNNNLLGYAENFLSFREQIKLKKFFKENNIEDITDKNNFGFLNGQLKYIDYED